MHLIVISNIRLQIIKFSDIVAGCIFKYGPYPVYAGKVFPLCQKGQYLGREAIGQIVKNKLISRNQKTAGYFLSDHHDLAASGLTM
jgi:hypothetical protein